jgi:Protein of unknown function (DUF3667)
MCGEKVFEEKQLSAKHFFHEVIDFFYHFENKVLKTIKLNFLKPGFVTKENLNGVRVPYAKPVQLYLVVAFVFYMVVSKVGLTDYIPTYGDQQFFTLSDYKLFNWAKPLDNWVINGIDSMWVRKGKQIEKKISYIDSVEFMQNKTFVLYGRGKMDVRDSVVMSPDKLPVVSFREMVQVRKAEYDAKISTYGKTLIFILIPIIACLFFLIFFKKIKYYGAALILATHFMIYNLCIYSLRGLIDFAPSKYYPQIRGWTTIPFRAILYSEKIAPFSGLVFGSSFEFLHLLFWMPWLSIAFRKLFDTAWWKAILFSYICSRVFFYLIFGVFKKALIAFTVWTMHV